MVKAFVFGKFLPFHKGHEAMINFALTKCDFLTVLVCCSYEEALPDSTRKSWIEKTFEGNKKLEFKSINYLESELPNTSVSSKEVSKIWSEKFKALFPNYHLLISSEPYGDYVASYMDITHLPFDLTKQRVAISASEIRNNLFPNWNFLPESVKSYFAIKVVILGTESTGKTILTEKLTQHFKCSSVKEAGRDLIADSNVFKFNDLLLVASEHAKRMDDSVKGQSPLIIVDTDIHITKSYARFKFNTELEVDDNIYQSNKADLYLYLNNDVDYIQDGTRLNKAERDKLDLSHRAVLKQHNIEITEIKGTWEERFKKAMAAIDQLLEKKSKLFI